MDTLIKNIFAFLTIFAFTSFCAGEDFDDVDSPNYSQLGPLSGIVLLYESSAPYVIYLGGFGGTAYDSYQTFQGEIEKSEILKNVNWIFLDPPPGGWFAITDVDGEGNPDVKSWQATLKKTRRLLDKMVAAAKIEAEKAIWAGFSQGAITATDYVLHSKVSYRGLIINSGMYFNSSDWQRKSPHLRGMRFFMSHDRQDDILPFSEAKKLEALLLDNGMSGKLQIHSKGHSVLPGFMENAIGVLLKNTAPTSKCQQYCLMGVEK